MRELLLQECQMLSAGNTEVQESHAKLENEPRVAPSTHSIYIPILLFVGSVGLLIGMMTNSRRRRF